MNKNVLIFGGVALVGVVAYLYFKPKAEAKSETMGADTMGAGTTGTGTTTVNTSTGTSGGATSSLSNTSDGVTPSDANLNLANATILATQRKALVAQTKPNLSPSSLGVGMFSGGMFGNNMAQAQAGANVQASIQSAKIKLAELDKKLATLGYKVDATDTLVKI